MAITCRDGKLYSIKNGDVRGSAVLIGGGNEFGWCSVDERINEIRLRDGERDRDGVVEEGRHTERERGEKGT